MIKTLKVNEDGQTQTFVKIGDYLYDQQVQKFGVSKFSMKKFKQLIGALLKYKQNCTRIKIFTRFMGLDEDNRQYDETDLDFYFKGI